MLAEDINDAISKVTRSISEQIDRDGEKKTLTVKQLLVLALYSYSNLSRK